MNIVIKIILGLITSVLLYIAQEHPNDLLHYGKYLIFTLTHVATINGLRITNEDKLSMKVMFVADFLLLFFKGLVLNVFIYHL
jgi:hypothetical protein